MSTPNYPIFPSFPTSCPGAQQWNLPNHSADPHLLQSPALSHCLPIISLAWISFPCIPCSLLASFGLSPILHPPHYWAFWSSSSNLFEGFPYLHPTCSSHNLLCFMPLGQVSNLNGTVTDYPFPKTKADVFGPNPNLICISLALLISGEGCRLQAAEQLRPRGWLHRITLRSSHYPSNGHG